VNNDGTNSATNKSIPSFFRFLTLMALRVFEKEGVQAAVFEVGIGGRSDATNVFKLPHLVVSGITSLGYDHMKVLGDSISSIAWHKSGILKSSVPGFTVNQLPEAMDVIVEQAYEVETSVRIVPPLGAYLDPSELATGNALGLHGQHQHENAALAIALSNVWLETSKYSRSDSKRGNYDPIMNNYEDVFLGPLSASFKAGLANCRWPGRGQTLTVEDVPNLVFYLDGAHTPESMEVCARWFKKVSENTTDDKETIKLLIFHCGSARDPLSLLTPLVNAGLIFQKAFFTTFLVTSTSAFGRAKADNDPQWQQHIVQTLKQLTTMDDSSCEQFACISDAISRVKEVSTQNSGRNVEVFVTGSLYLVGGVLEVLDYKIT